MSRPEAAPAGTLNQGRNPSDRTGMRRRAWLVYPVVGGILTLAYLLIRPLNVGPVFNLIGYSSPVMILVAIRIWKP